VSVIGPWAGPDLDSFWAVAQPFAQREDVKLSFESTPDVGSVLAARLEAATPPDVAILPGIGLLREYARAGLLVPLRGVLSLETLRRRYPEGWLEAVSVDGEVYGAFYRVTHKSLVWYNPGEFQSRRWTVPLTWEDLVTLSDRIARSGLTPWSVGLHGRSASGEPGTDWVESIVLRTAGPAAYDRWVRHEIPWTDEVVREAFLQWWQIVGRPRNLYGGPRTALETDWSDAVDALYQSLPVAYLCLEGSLMQPLIARRFPRQMAEKDYDFFLLPSMSLEDETPVLAGAEIIVVFNDTPAARALVQYLTSPAAQAIWVRQGGFVVPNRELDPAEYPDCLSRRAARQLLEAEILRFDASQQMPAPVAEAFRQAVREFVANPGRLDAILAGVERVARDTYAGRSGAGPGAAGGRAVRPVRPEWLIRWRITSPLGVCGGRRLNERLQLPAWLPTVGARGGTPG
jgi:alpha-glucoside transport system substrate-binding protein